MAEDKNTVEIIVNGRKRNVPSSALSAEGEIFFDQVVKLAYDPPPSGPDIVFTVSYRNAGDAPRDGSLVKGKSVKIQDGTVFNVTFTDKS